MKNFLSWFRRATPPAPVAAPSREPQGGLYTSVLIAAVTETEGEKPAITVVGSRDFDDENVAARCAIAWRTAARWYPTAVDA